MALLNQIFVLLPFLIFAWWIRSWRPIPPFRILPSPFTFAYSILFCALCDDIAYYCLHRCRDDNIVSIVIQIIDIFNKMTIRNWIWTRAGGWCTIGRLTNTFTSCITNSRLPSPQQRYTVLRSSMPLTWSPPQWFLIILKPDHRPDVYCLVTFIETIILYLNNLIGSVDSSIAHGCHVRVVRLLHHWSQLRTLRLRHSLPLLPLSFLNDARFSSRETKSSILRQIRTHGLRIWHRSTMEAAHDRQEEKAGNGSDWKKRINYQYESS